MSTGRRGHSPPQRGVFGAKRVVCHRHGPPPRGFAHGDDLHRVRRARVGSLGIGAAGERACREGRGLALERADQPANLVAPRSSHAHRTHHPAGAACADPRSAGAGSHRDGPPRTQTRPLGRRACRHRRGRATRDARRVAALRAERSADDWYRDRERRSAHRHRRTLVALCAGASVVDWLCVRATNERQQFGHESGILFRHCRHCAISFGRIET